MPDGHILVRVSSLNEAVDEVEKIIISEYAKDRNFQPGDIVRHFKQQYVQDGSKKHYYRYLGTALHTETKEILAIYQMLFPDSEGVRKTFARPMHMFAGHVDNIPHSNLRPTKSLGVPGTESADVAGFMGFHKKRLRQEASSFL